MTNAEYVPSNCRVLDLAGTPTGGDRSGRHTGACVYQRGCSITPFRGEDRLLPNLERLERPA